jgi:hypothetical protein
MNDHEEKFVEVFVRKAKRDRSREQLASSKHRRKFTASFGHSADLTTEPAQQIDPKLQSPAGIHSILTRKGAPCDCYLISEDAELDRKLMDLQTALEEIIGYGNGTFVSCIPGKLGYFESAEPGVRYIFEKR